MANLVDGLSNAALRYLNDPKFDEKFCEDCEAIVYHEGVFCSGSGFAEPPHVECPCDFVFLEERMRAQEHVGGCNRMSARRRQNMERSGQR